MRRLLLLPLLLLLFVFQYSAGFLSSLWSSTSQVKNETKSSATDHSENADSLCLRMHNNTAFLGTNPISKLNLPSAFDCKELCIDIYPKCKAVIFYYMFDKEKEHICYLFDRNSVEKNVALVPEKPFQRGDMVRALEIVVNCREFDAFPPPQAEFVESTDKVSKHKREVGFGSHVPPLSPWTKWSECAGRVHSIRTRAVEYGRQLERRKCRAVLQGPPQVKSANVLGTEPVIIYPPTPYSHPQAGSVVYDNAMEIHRGQELQSCYLGNPACPHSFPVYPCGAPGPIYGIIGPQCPPLSQPMEWGEWRAWTPCSATCGLGITSRSRPCKTGICIGVAKEWQYCQNPTPCETWSSWTKWSQCSVTCGQGERIRRRYCLLGEGRCQGYDAERMVCHGEYGAKCDEWGHWSSWSQCSATCGEGRRTRYRSCRGERCPGPKSQSERCYLAACPGPEWSAWLDWSACSVTCGRGIRQRSRTCVNGQTCPGSSVETEECVAARACAAWSTWGAWSSCSNLCGQGEMTRRRECLTPNGVESYECVGSAMESQTCSERSGCVSWGAWSGWSECSNKCGYGTMTRKRECVDVRGYSASGCQGMDTDTKTCSEKSGCASWGTWLEWSGCSTNCGEGTMTRRRDCLDSNGYPATSCEGMDMDTRTCSEKSGCASWGTWLEWSGCSTNCGEGTMTRKRDCLDSSGYSTTGCEGMDTDTQTCSEKSGCASWGTWLEWSGCSTNCGEGTMTRRRECVDSSGYSTTGCEGTDTDTRTCSEKSGCASWGAWLEWSGCSTNCGEGTMTRRRDCLDSSGYSTVGCEGMDTDTQTCTEKSGCASWGAWLEWSGCSSSCGEGTMTRHRECVDSSGYPSSNCEGVDTERSSCHDESGCAQWGDWTPWSTCSTMCGIGTKERHRACQTPDGYPSTTCVGLSTATTRCEERSGCSTWSPWSMWSECSAMCGEGSKTRTRECLSGSGQRRPPSECTGPAEDTQRCTATAGCAHWTEWKEWSKCSQDCGIGVKSRHRDCVTNAGYYSKECEGPFMETVECVGDSPRCAEWSSWKEWSPCSTDCGDGKRTRQRTCQDRNGYPSTRCIGSATESKDCYGESGCASWGAWSGWSQCSTKCGEGTMSRRRECVDARGYPSSSCRGIDTDVRSCSERSGCASWGMWLEWSKCSSSCGQGIMERKRECLDSRGYPVPGCIGRNTESRPCYEQSGCASWGSWSEWSECSTLCGDGTMTRSRECFDPSGYPTSTCQGKNMDSQRCTEKSGCASWGAWLEWSGCSTNCGEGTMTRQRECVDSSGYPASNCPGKDTDSRSCSETSGCASWGTWLEWSSCSTNCGEGTMTRKRECFDSSGHSSSDCEGTDTDTQNCYEKSGCASWGAWLEWSGCSTKCGEGTMTRKRECFDSDGYSTTGCDGTDTDTQSCSEKSGCASWGEWLEWSECSTNCGEGTMTRKRECLDSDGYSTTGCEGTDTDTQSCSEKSGCASWGEWLDWSECSTKCGQGTMTRTRDCVDASGYSATGCEGASTDTKTCSEESGCASWGTWLEWSGCSTNCGEGIMTRKRECFDSDGYSASGCDGTDTETQKCYGKSGCASWSAWLEWSGCSTSCGEGKMIRRRNCVDSNGYIASGCMGTDMEERLCSDRSGCPYWTEWDAWTECSADCGRGEKLRRRQCMSPKGHATVGCVGKAMERESCIGQASHCAQWSNWGAWSQCSVECGHGEKFRMRTCLSLDGRPSSNCRGQDRQTASCIGARPVCPEWGEWSSWSACSAAYGPGRKTRSRQCLLNGAQAYGCHGYATETQQCVGGYVPYQWTVWSGWSQCSAKCGGGTQTRVRQCILADGQKSLECRGSASEERRCNEHACEKLPYCMWSTWSDWSACDSQCGTGMMSRTRQCIQINGGDALMGTCVCDGPYVQYSQCSSTEGCDIIIQEPSRCEWSAWYPWSSCIGGNQNSAERTYIRMRDCRGDYNCKCAGESTQVLQCPLIALG